MRTGISGKEALVSIDAMACQTQIARELLDAGADYLLSVQDNQKHLHRAIQKALETQPRKCSGKYRDIETN